MDEKDIQTTLINIISKICEKRKQKGYSVENMAQELGLSNSAYNKKNQNLKQPTFIDTKCLFIDILKN